MVKLERREGRIYAFLSAEDRQTYDRVMKIAHQKTDREIFWDGIYDEIGRKYPDLRDKTKIFVDDIRESNMLILEVCNHV